jgi:flagellar basal-body rod protein FlgC
MEIKNIASPVDIAVSGLKAEGLRMNVISANIANANTSRTEEGGPYRRKDVVFSTLMDRMGGVNVEGVVDDYATDFKQVYQPGHPDANDDGFVMMPNVDLPVEMVQLVTASRAYQANAAVLKRYQENVDVTLELLK